MLSRSKSMREKRKRARKEKYLKGLKRNIDSPLPPLQVVIRQTSGRVKISTALVELVEPYARSAVGEEAYRMLVTIAVLAWNLCLLPENERQALIEKTLPRNTSVSDQGTGTELLCILDALIERKRTLYPQDSRYILSFEVTAGETGYHITAISYPGEFPNP